LPRQRKWPFLCRGRDFLPGLADSVVLAAAPWFSPLPDQRAPTRLYARRRWTFSDVGPTWPFLADSVVFAAAPWFSPLPDQRAPTRLYARRRWTFSDVGPTWPFSAGTVVLVGAPWFFTVSRPPRAHPTIVHRVVRRFPTSPRLSRLQPVPSFWLARHGFSPYLDRRAPTRL
jgi:hypothetical protein